MHGARISTPYSAMDTMVVRVHAAREPSDIHFRVECHDCGRRRSRSMIGCPIASAAAAMNADERVKKNAISGSYDVGPPMAPAGMPHKTNAKKKNNTAVGFLIKGQSP